MNGSNKCAATSSEGLCERPTEAYSLQSFEQTVPRKTRLGLLQALGHWSRDGTVSTMCPPYEKQKKRYVAFVPQFFWSLQWARLASPTTWCCKPDSETTAGQHERRRKLRCRVFPCRCTRSTFWSLHTKENSTAAVSRVAPETELAPCLHSAAWYPPQIQQCQGLGPPCSFPWTLTGGTTYYSRQHPAASKSQCFGGRLWLWNEVRLYYSVHKVTHKACRNISEHSR